MVCHMSAGFKMDMSRLSNIVKNGIKNIPKTKDLMADIGEALVSSSKMRFETETDPQGKKWVKGYKQSGKTLADSGTLKRSITHNANISEVIYGSNLEYAAIHNDGGDIEAKTSKGLRFQVNGRWVTKKLVTMPKREFIGISDDDKAEAMEMIMLHIKDSFKDR